MAKARKFISSDRSTSFHDAASDCGHLRRMPDDIRIKFRTLKSAVAAGKKPCPFCVLPKRERKPRIRKKPRVSEGRPGIDVVRGPATAKTHGKRGFAKGNPGGPGNPHLKEIKKEREAFAVALRSFDPSHVRDVLWAMYKKATGPERNVAAANIFLNQTLGRPAVAILLKGESGPLEKLMEIIREGRNGKKPIKKIDVDVIEKAERDAKR